jgi:hypothetical protein
MLISFAKETGLALLLECTSLLMMNYGDYSHYLGLLICLDTNLCRRIQRYVLVGKSFFQQRMLQLIEKEINTGPECLCSLWLSYSIIPLPQSNYTV